MKRLLDIIVESLEDIGNIDRSHMPQVDTDNLPDAITKMANDVNVKKGMVSANSLKKTQKQINIDKIRGIADTKLLSKSDVKKMKPIIISKDNYVVDGHHRWVSVLYKFGKDIKVPVYAIQAPIKDALVLYSQIAKEVQPLSEARVLSDLEKRFNIDLDVYDNGNYLTLSRIVIPKEERGKGIGEEVMNLIIQFADSQKKSIYLTPDTTFGATSKSRLEKFYKRFGFIKKPKDDFLARETMVRYPLSDKSFREKKRALEMISEVYTTLTEKIVKVDNKYVVYPKKGGKRLGTHNTYKDALKQLQAIEISKNEDVIPGGLAKGMSLRDIANHHGVDYETMKKYAADGVKVEMEHTTSKEVAYEIAKDHLYENPKYYIELAKIEESVDRNTDFNKVKFYEDYYRNVSPSDFSILSENDGIKIKFPTQPNITDVNEAQAISGGKIHKFITGKGLTYKGKKFDEIEFELVTIDNTTNTVKLKILSPKELFGKVFTIPFKTIRRGSFVKTETHSKNINEDNELYAFEIELGKLLMSWSKYKTFLLDKSFARNLSIKPRKTYTFIYDNKRYSAYFGETSPKSSQYMAYDVEIIEESDTSNDTVYEDKASVLNEIPMSDLIAVDNYADDMLNPIDVVLTDKHFFDRVRDPRNGKEITDTELMDFFDRLADDKEKFLDFLKRYKTVVATDVQTDINIAFMVKADRAIAKTIMRKKNFKTSDKQMKI